MQGLRLVSDTLEAGTMLRPKRRDRERERQRQREESFSNKCLRLEGQTAQQSTQLLSRPDGQHGCFEGEGK